MKRILICLTGLVGFTALAGCEPPNPCDEGFEPRRKTEYDYGWINDYGYNPATGKYEYYSHYGYGPVTKTYCYPDPDYTTAP